MGRLAPSQRLEALWLSLGAWPLVARVRLALWLEPFPRFYAHWNAKSEHLCRQHNSTLDDQAREPSAEERRNAWNRAFAVRRAARFFPHASCLTQALVLQRTLAHIGQPCTLRFGASRGGESAQKLEAHAWIEWHGRVLIGGDVSSWTPFPASSSVPDARSSGSSPSPS